MATTFLRIDSPRKHPFLTSSSPLETFRAEERLRLRGRNSILITQINVFIINLVVMGFQIWICTILLVFWSILVKCCVHLPTSRSKTQMLLLENTIFHKCWLFCQRFFAFTSDLCGLLSFVYSVYQSAPPTGFQTDFTSSVWNFCRWNADVPPREKSSVAKSEEKRMFSQAKEEITVVETFQSGVISLSRERELLTHTSLLVV